MSEIPEIKNNDNAPRSKLDASIAVMVSIAASAMAVFNIKDNNIVQAMSQAQAHAVDAWAYYQSKSTKEHLAENSKSQLELMLATQGAASQQIEIKLHKMIQESQVKIEKYEKEKAEIKSQAEGFQNEYDRLNFHDDQFDLAEALLSISLSLFGITALVQNKRLFIFALALSGIGVFFGIAGFLEWNIHPEWITKILS
jgi:hypothetical protein